MGRAEAALTCSLMTLLTLGVGPVAAALVARLGHRLTTLLGVLLASAGLLAAGTYIRVAGEEQSILVVHLTVGGMVGLGFGLMYLPAMDIVPHFFSRRLGLATGLAAAGSGVGQVVLAPVLHLATASLGLATTLQCLAGLVACAALFALLYKLPGELNYRGISPSVSRRSSAEAIEGGEVTVNKDTPDRTCKLTLLLLLTSHFLFNIGVFSTFTFTTDRAVQRNLTPAQSSLLLSIMGISNCFGRIFFGLILDRFRQHAIVLTVSVMTLNAAAILASDLLPDLLGQAAFSTIFGLTFGCYISSVVVILSLLCPSITTPLGLTLLTVGISSLAGPLAVGGLYDLTGGHTMGFLVAGGLAAVGALLPLLLPRPRECS